MKTRNKIILLLLTMTVLFQLVAVNTSADASHAAVPIETVSKDFTPMTMSQEALVTQLEAITKEQGIGDSFKNTYSVRETVDQLVNTLGYEIDNQSVIQGVPREMIASVLFREMICYDIFDKYGDGVLSKTIGIAQISADGVRNNDKLVAKNESTKPKYQEYSTEQLNNMLENKILSVGFAAMALKARAYREKVPVDSEDKVQVQKILAGYNDYNGEIRFISDLGRKVGLKLKMPEIGPVQYKETYGKETYEYYKIFKEYYKFS